LFRKGTKVPIINLSNGQLIIAKNGPHTMKEKLNIIKVKITTKLS
jgi:hypothetical protein